MNQDSLRFEISKVLVGKGKGKLILRLYTSWPPLGLLISWYLSLFLSSVLHPLPERVYVCFTNPDCLQYATDLTTFLHQEDCLHREGSSDCLGHLAQMHATALNSEWTLKEILNILVGNVIRHLQLRPYLFGKGTTRKARTSCDIPIVLPDINPIFSLP